MTCQATMYQWHAILREHLPHLSKPQTYVLALWSGATVLTRSCSLSTVSLLLAQALERPENSVRQQLREWCYEATQKRGSQRCALDVEACFAPLLGWVLSQWQGTQLALALDATSLGERFVVLCIRVLYRGCALPVAWSVLPANQPGAWRGHWLRLLRRLRPAVPASWCVLVLADRGLYAGRLFRRIVRLGWHPCLRINGGGTFRAQGHSRYQPLNVWVTHLQGCGSVRGVAFQGPRRLECTLGVYWDKGCHEPWLVLSDLPPEQHQACWYGLRAWIEHGFKLTKREGWQWQRTRMSDPQRVARLWLVLAVATLWVVTLGSQAEETVQTVDQLQDQGPSGTAPAGVFTDRRPRRVSLFRRGWTACLVALWRGQALCSLGRGPLQPEPWPVMPSLVTCWHDTS